MKSLRWICLVVLFAGGCVTPYQTFGFLGGTFAIKHSDGTWGITSSGNSFTPRQATIDYVWVKAAEITKEQGAVCFDILESSLDTVTYVGSNSVPITSQPLTRMRIRIRDDLKTCDDATNADAILTRLGAKVRDTKNYSR